MSKTVVYMIGQAHLDPVWLWRWTEGRAEALATCQSAVDRLGEYADFVFTRGESLVYQWVEEEDPALFERIKELIGQGRWHVVNGMVIQPDMNIPQGESFVRQVLLGKSYMRARLGVEPTVAYCVDSFGHAGTLPQILRGCGFDAYVFMRPGPHEKELPAQAFWWQGRDGSRILTFRISGAYMTRVADQIAHLQRAVDDQPAALSRTMCFFGVGDHGGGPTKQQIENIQAIAAARDDVEIRFGGPGDYFAAVRPLADQLPVVADELQFHAVGCYSAVSSIKRGHRQAENGLLLAERIALLAHQLVGHAIPVARLRELWQDLCFNQFHDTLGGSSIKEACDDAVMAFGRTILSASEICQNAGRAIAARVDTTGAGGAFVLFNPFPQQREYYVEYEPWTGWQPWEAGRWELFDDGGLPVPYQRIDTREALTAPNGGINRLLFRASVPPLGYRAYRFGPDSPQVIAEGSAQAGDHSLENDLLALRLDPASGAISSCIDKASGLELVGPGGWNVAQVLSDPSDTWSHNVRGYSELIGTFGAPTITVATSGPLEASLLVERRYGSSTWLQQIILRHGEDAITIRNWLDWSGQWQLLKLAFDLPTDRPVATHDVPFGTLERPCDGAEVPTQMWMDVSGSARERPEATIGAALLNDSKYGCDVSGSSMRLTVLRCPPYAYHIPHPFGSRKRYDWIDQGPQEFTLVLCPHVGDWRESGVVARARALNMPELIVTTHAHPGILPPQDSLVELRGNDLELTALKAAEDGDGVIVRLADCHGRGASGELHWRGQRFPVQARPCEVVTLRLSERNGTWGAERCDMIERSDK